jgi:N-methylhydantoinase A/oxoprolinase/acetone carboxylase beta subunit
VIEIRRGDTQDLWDAYKDVAPPYIHLRDRFEVSERVGYSGRELESVDEEDAPILARTIGEGQACRLYRYPGRGGSRLHATLPVILFDLC